MHIVVPFNRGQALGKECDQVPFPVVFRELLQDPTGREVGTIGFDLEWLTIVREHKYGRTDDPLLQLFKCHIAFRRPAERHVLHQYQPIYYYQIL